MRRTISITALLFAWLCANGAIWNAVQVFAWGKMFAGYAQSMTVCAALDATFDAEHPCAICLSVASAKDSADKDATPATAASSEKLILLCNTPAPVVLTGEASEWPPGSSTLPATRIDPIPAPPPRA